ncbi:hypothetical protein FB45DRAFT_902794 [Roridomyces roridus]|uniref:Uncharacterized protein n=1 Tax=Roridomyces roridus TaxID=1738132 RepID=A0AAD7C3Y7_9AGAR|nr:hypothetical protein FB45DRAFT_902794 [Roridomyces roridus]
MLFGYLLLHLIMLPLVAYIALDHGYIHVHLEELSYPCQDSSNAPHTLDSTPLPPRELFSLLYVSLVLFLGAVLLLSLPSVSARTRASFPAIATLTSLIPALAILEAVHSDVPLWPTSSTMNLLHDTLMDELESPDPTLGQVSFYLFVFSVVFSASASQ